MDSCIRFNAAESHGRLYIARKARGNMRVVKERKRDRRREMDESSHAIISLSLSLSLSFAEEPRAANAREIP